jgi:hypothetical protein
VKQPHLADPWVLSVTLLEFLGANVLDEKPFIVMPLLRNGNARDYIQDHPTYDRLQLVGYDYVTSSYGQF